MSGRIHRSRQRVNDRAEFLTRIAALHRIEGEIAGRPAEARQLVLEARSRPLLIALERFLRDKLALVSRKCTLAVAIRYAVSLWTGLTLYVEDGRVEWIPTRLSDRLDRSRRRGRTRSAGSDRIGRTWA